jgi:hypothetical protein
MTAASKSALIEQLKARHSSQQHKLQELTVRVEQTRKDNRRLRNTLLFLVAAAIAIVVAVFHNRIFPPSPARPPLPPATGVAPAGKKPPPAGPAHIGTQSGWLLDLNGKQIALSKGSVLPRSFHPEATVGTSEDDYARVAFDEKKGMVLINDSKDKWTVNGKGKRIGTNDDVKLGEKPLTIVFASGLKGTLTPDAPAAGSDTP